MSARRYRYTGKERDEETGLYYNGARYLAAWLGRWTSADPIGMQAGVNLYQYCRGSPINYTDPSGTDDVPATRALNEPHSTLPSGLIIPTHDDTNWSEDKSIGTRIGELIDSLDLTANEPGQAGNATPLVSNADLAYGVKIETWKLEADYEATDEQGHELWEANDDGGYDFVGDSGRYLQLPIGTSDVEVFIATAGVGEVVGAAGSRLSAALGRATAGGEAMAGGAAGQAAGNSGKTIRLYRGVNDSNARFASQVEGVVTPNAPSAASAEGRIAAALEHNTAPRGTHESPFTSWTTDPDVAAHFALWNQKAIGSGVTTRGVVITADVPIEQIVASPNLHRVGLAHKPGTVVSESEALVTGVVKGDVTWQFLIQ